jgi:hypothetical protein
LRNSKQDDNCSDTSGESQAYKLHKLDKSSSDQIVVTMTLNGKNLEIEVNTGAALSVISEATRKAIFPKEKLHLAEITLSIYTDEHMQVHGTLNVKVQHNNQEEKLKLVVVAGNGPSLLGRNWLKYILLDCYDIIIYSSCC